MAAYTNPICERFRGCGTFASSRARVLSLSQLTNARTVHELGNEAPLITVRTAGEFYRQDNNGLSGQRARLKSYPRRVRSNTRSCMASIGDLPLQLFTTLAYTLRSHQKQAQSIVIPKVSPTFLQDYIATLKHLTLNVLTL